MRVLGKVLIIMKAEDEEVEDKKLNKRAVASEVISSGFCPLDCDYCYIPKTDEMKEMHGDIVEKLKTGEWMEQLDELYQDVNHLSFWGTEPLLILGIVVDQIDEAVEKFGGLEQVAFSTSMCVDPSPIAKLKEKLDEHDIRLSWQVSADGHYTDENRIEGATEKIKSNLIELGEKLDEGELTVRWKGTIGIDNIREMAEDPEEIEKYMEYYDEIREEVREATDGVEFDQKSRCPTLMVPGKYTSEDGKAFAKYLKNMVEAGYSTTYTPRLKRVMRDRRKLEEKPAMFTCSGGDSNFGMDDGNVHICHRTFYHEREDYLESIKDQERYKNWDVSLLDEGILDMETENYMAEKGDDLIRFQYIMRNFHDHWMLRLDNTEAMLIELAKCGQADEIYKENEELRSLLALFLHTSHSCPVENLLNTGVVHFMPVSMKRLWANGAFRELLKTMDGDFLERQDRVTVGGG